MSEERLRQNDHERELGIPLLEVEYRKQEGRKESKPRS